MMSRKRPPRHWDSVTQPVPTPVQHVRDEQPFGPKNGRRRIGLWAQHLDAARSQDHGRRVQVKTWTRLPRVKRPMHAN